MSHPIRERLDMMSWGWSITKAMNKEHTTVKTNYKLTLRQGDAAPETYQF